MKTRKLLSLILAIVTLLGCITITTFAQETKQLTVNDGTTTNSNVPYNAYYVDTSGMRSQFLLDYADVEAIWGNKITKMTFYVQSGNSVDATFEIRLKVVEEYQITNFLDTTDATVVYSGTFSIANGKIEIPFTNDFYFYQQSGFVHSLLVDISMTSTAALNGKTYFYGVGISSAKTFSKYGSTKINQYFSPKVTFDYEVPTYLDLETDDTYSNTKEIEQLYDATVTENKTDVTKVQVSWTLTDISASITMNKIWDPDELEWVDNKSVDNTATAEDVTATFEFKNLSSVKINAQVAFQAENGITATATYVDNGTTDDGTILLDSRATNSNATLTGNVAVTVPADTDYFAKLTEDKTDVKYGTYTITISEAKPNYLTFTANTAGSTITPAFKSGTYQYSTDNGTTWLDGSNSGTTITLANEGDSVMLKGTNCVTSEYSYFSMTGSISASGSVTSLTDGFGADKNVALSNGCYYYMFFNCSALTTAPELPATTLTDSCYFDMFYKTSITVAPALPATALANACYKYMFEKCSCLTTAPALPATDLANECYSSMFSYCTALTTAPAILATKLAYKSCSNMFGDCTALTAASTLLANDLSENCYKWMFDGCTSLKITTEKPVSGTEGTDWGVIFSGAKTVGTDAVTSMFNKCVCDSGVATTPVFADGTTYYWYK